MRKERRADREIHERFPRDMSDILKDFPGLMERVRQTDTPEGEQSLEAEAGQAHSVSDIEETEKEDQEQTPPAKHRNVVRNTVLIVIAIAAVTVIMATLFLPVLKVSGSSMEPTLESGDIIALWNGGSYEAGDLAGFYYQNKLLVKRVIAGPGDTVNIDADGNVYVNNELLDEPYVTNRASGWTDREYPYQVPEGRYFVLSDDRSSTVDSRDTNIGCIELDQFVGKVFLRVWPLSRLSVVK